MQNHGAASPAQSAPLAQSLHAATSGQRLLFVGALAVLTSLLLPMTAAAQTTSSYTQTNIVSDGAVTAMQTDPTLINPWGISIGPQFWIDAAGSGFSEVDDANGNKAFAVAIPAASASEAHGSPAGTIYNSDSTVFVIPGSTSAQFLFGNLDGSIAAWNPSTPQAVTVVNNAAAKASYTDIAVDKNATGTFLLAANFAGGTVDVFSSSFASTHLAGTFTDPAIPSGYSPFGIHSIGSNIYVTYAEVDPSTGREMVGAGLGYVDVFNNNGDLIQQAISQGNLNAPWGMALAPAGFGSFGGDLLVGNFGDGTINVYDPTHFSLLGQLQDSTGKAITNSGLWEIVFGSNGVGDPNTLYFAAGINGEKDGLFGSIAVASPAAGVGDFSFQASVSKLSVTTGQSGSVTLDLAGMNGFSGPITLSCSGLPTGDSCTFTPSTVSLSGTTTASVTASISTAAATSGPNPYSAAKHPLSSRQGHAGLALAFLSPFGFLALIGVRKKSSLIRGSMLTLVLAMITLTMAGCSSSSMPSSGTPAPTTPASPTPVTSQVSINATSGAISHSVTIALTVN